MTEASYLVELRENLDKERIKELIARLARAVDRVDEAGIRACYCRASCDEHGPFVGTGAEFAARSERQAPSNVSSHHMMGQSLVDLRGDEAYAETYFIGHHVHEMAGDLVEARICGRYLDHVVRLDREWKLKFRRVVLDWATSGTAREWSGMREFPLAQRWPDDDVFHPERLAR